MEASFQSHHHLEAGEDYFIDADLQTETVLEKAVDKILDAGFREHFKLETDVQKYCTEVPKNLILKQAFNMYWTKFSKMFLF